MAAFGSVDQTGNYVFQVRPEVTAEVTGRMIPFWSVEGADDTVLSLWNLEEADADLLLSLVLDREDRQTLNHPIHLAPGGSHQVSFRSLLEQPDEDGHRAPAEVVPGRYRLAPI